MSSPYLDKPLRTEAEAKFDIVLQKLNDAAAAFRADPARHREFRDLWASLARLEVASVRLRKEVVNARS